MGEIREGRDAAEHADLVEVRLDGVDNPDPAAALLGRRTPVVVTCRPEWEGGTFRGSEDTRRGVLERALELGAEFVDVEAAAPFAADLLRLRHGRGIVLSAHVFDEAPADLRARYVEMCQTPAEVVKLAIDARRLADVSTLLGLASAEESRGRDRVLIAMGSSGVASRVLAAKLGNRWTYAGNAVAPGQMPADRLIREFQFRRIHADAAVFGVTGKPIGHSLSPVIHNAGFAATGANAAFVPLEAADARDFERFARTAGVQGASITAPYKVDLMSSMDELDPLAQRVGAINTLVVRGGRWIGFNTDLSGFIEPLAARMPIAGIRATVLGAGGAARAAVVALIDRGARVTISARRAEQAAQVADATGATAGEFPPPPDSWDLLVNATPAGSVAQPGIPVDPESLTGGVVYDLVYAPERTELLDASARRGCRIIGGLEMLVAQAERQFELWTGQRPPVGLFLHSAERAIAARNCSQPVSRTL